MGEEEEGPRENSSDPLPPPAAALGGGCTDLGFWLLPRFLDISVACACGPVRLSTCQLVTGHAWPARGSLPEPPGLLPCFQCCWLCPPWGTSRPSLSCPWLSRAEGSGGCGCSQSGFSPECGPCGPDPFRPLPHAHWHPQGLAPGPSGWVWPSALGLWEGRGAGGLCPPVSLGSLGWCEGPSVLVP